MAGSMATTSNAAMRKKTPFYVSIFMIHDTRRRPAAVWGIRQGAATTHGGKRRCFMFRYFRFVTLDVKQRPKSTFIPLIALT